MHTPLLVSWLTPVQIVLQISDNKGLKLQIVLLVELLLYGEEGGAWLTSHHHDEGSESYL